MLIAAQTEFDRWLDQHPVVLGLGALLIGAMLLAFAARTIVTGTARTKWGREVEGAEAHVYGVIRLVAGIGLILFGAYKILAGLW